MQRPAASEYIPEAANYVALVPDGDFLRLLDKNKTDTFEFFSAIPADKENYAYKPGKWTPKQMLLHLADTERVFAYRALTIARGDSGAVFPNMDQNLFSSNADAAQRTLDDLAAEFSVVRDSSIFLFKYLSEAQLKAQGKLFDRPVTPFGFGYCIIGHAMHHMNVLKERYGL